MSYHLPVKGVEAPRTPVVISRRRWLRGEGAATSMLLREDDGKMCCVGFMCKARGYTDSEIQNRGGVHSLADPTKMGVVAAQYGWLTTYEPLYRINDVPDGQRNRGIPGTLGRTPMTPELREREITERAKLLGFDVTFED